MGMLNGDMGQDDTIGESDFGPEGNETSSNPVSGLGGMVTNPDAPNFGQPNIGSWATAKDPDRTMDQAMSLFSKEDDPAISMAKAYGLKGQGYAYSDSFDFSKSAKQHTAFIVDLMNQEFQKTYGKNLKDSYSVYSAMTEEQKEAMKADAKSSTTGILSGIPDNMRDDVAMGISVTIADMFGLGPKADTEDLPDFLGLPKHSGIWGAIKTGKANLAWSGYKTALSLSGNSLAAQIANYLGEDPSQESDVTAIESGDGPN